MTWGGGKPHAVGYTGQRYEVSYQQHESSESGGRTVFGWSDTLSGARRMVNSIDLHPSMFHPQIWDRQNQVMVNLA